MNKCLWELSPVPVGFAKWDYQTVYSLVSFRYSEGMSAQTTTSTPLMPEAKMNLVKPKAPVTGRVVTNDLCLKSKSNCWVRHTAIDVSGTPLEGNFLVGQSFGVIAPGEDENGKPHKVRLYSIACPSWGEDGAGKVLSTTPKRLLDERKPQKGVDDPEDHRLFVGVCSNYLCDLRPGDEVQITGPNGKRFLIPVNPADHDYVFVATGTGIAPFRGMVLELLENPAGKCERQIHLLMGSPYTSDLLYDDLFTEMARKHDNFHYHTAISRERRPDGSRGIYVDRIFIEETEMLQPLLADSQTIVYVCGLLGMQYGIYKAFSELGVGDGYFTVKDDLAGIPHAEWSSDQMKKSIRATPRCILEVY